MAHDIPRDLGKTEKLAALDEIATERLGGLTLKSWQGEAVCELLTGNDVLLLAPTGAGKSLLFYLYALARPTEVVLVVSPLKMLEKNMVQNIEKVDGLTAIDLNADTLSQAQREDRDIWEECRGGKYRIILCSPELLPEPPMDALLTHESFRRRLRCVVVDELHLIPIWGGETATSKAFRRAFRAIGTVRSRLDSTLTVFLGMSATLMPGKPIETVEKSLGFRKPKYRQIKLDCERTNIHITIRRIREGSTDGTFRDLDWILADLLKAEVSDPNLVPKTVIYVDNIPKGYQIVLYLQRLLPASLQAQAGEIIRHIHASTCPKCKDEVLADFSSDGPNPLRVVVATDVFGCGIDIKDIFRVIIFGTPRDLNSAYQRLGRLARAILFGYGYIYVNAVLWDETATRLGLLDVVRSRRARASKQKDAPEGESPHCPYFIKVLEAHLQRQCVSKVINELYANPKTGPPRDCGRCSGCVEDEVPEPVTKKAPKAKVPPPFPWLRRSRARGVGVIRKEAAANARRKLTAVALDAYLNIPADGVNFFEGPEDFLPQSKIGDIVKHLRDLETNELVKRALGDDWKFMDSHGDNLAAEALRIRDGLLAEHEEIRQRSSRARNPHDESAEGSDENESETGGEGSDQSESQAQGTAGGDRPLCPHEIPRLVIRIPANRLAGRTADQ